MDLTRFQTERILRILGEDMSLKGCIDGRGPPPHVLVMTYGQLVDFAQQFNSDVYKLVDFSEKKENYLVGEIRGQLRRGELIVTDPKTYSSANKGDRPLDLPPNMPSD